MGMIRRMRSHALDLRAYDTDKIPHGYLRWYDPLFTPLADRPIRLLEIGVKDGESLRLWRDYFPQGTIVGLDLAPPRLYHGSRVTVVTGDQSRPETWIDQIRDLGPYDIIIDDASHVAQPTRASFGAVWPLIVPGGLFVLEDWGVGYWACWPDGAAVDPTAPWGSHAAGLVGFVKGLIDDVGSSPAGLGPDHPGPLSPFAQVTVTPYMVVVTKPR